jgi:hypothetical protein
MVAVSGSKRPGMLTASGTRPAARNCQASIIRRVSPPAAGVSRLRSWQATEGANDGASHRGTDRVS